MSWYFCVFLMCLTLSSFVTKGIDALYESRRIVKGYKVDIKSFPHAAFLFFDISRPSTCGSSIITLKAVITSAHCLRELKTYKGGIHVFLGSTVPLFAKVTRNVTTYRIHPYYNPHLGKFDLGVAKLDREVPMGETIRKIPISVKSFNINGTFITVGWGKQWPRVFPDFSVGRYLKASKQKLLTTHDCHKHAGIRVTPAFLCSIPHHGYHYRGDFGNGLVTFAPQMSLTGVVSFMVKDATLYANVLAQKKWVRQAVEALYEKEPVDKDCC